MPSAANPGPTPVTDGDANRNNSESQQNKRDLASWWKQFKRSEKKGQEQQALPVQGIFGVPLSVSIRYANVAISLFNEEGQGYIYGYVPIVVAKCGVYLKENATDVEGIFRLAGSEKRIKELKVAFDSPDRYGKGLDWTGYTVHDAANILRRYFNQLPEPIIPLSFYEKARAPLRDHQQLAPGQTTPDTTPLSKLDVEAAIKIYQSLITELPPLNRQLLLYILDLLAVFASKSDLNKMTTSNLAAIFQPGLLSHPQHDMAPAEYRLSQDVLIFLIENQDSFLIGMPGTAADQATVKEVQSGAPSPGRSPGSPDSPGRSKPGLGRSSSNASSGKWNLRRGVSVSSRQSKQSGNGPMPSTPGPASPGASSGVQRSNTVPSRRAGSTTHSPKFSREKGSGSGTQSPLADNGISAGVLEAPTYGSAQSTPVAPAPSAFVTSASSSEATTPVAGLVGSDSARELQTPRRDTTPLLAPLSASGDSTERSTSITPSTGGRGFLNILKQSPSSDGDGRKPNKLQKKRIPGSALSSAHSSSHDLGADEPMASSQQFGVLGAIDSAISPSPNIQRNPTDATVRRAPSPARSNRSHTSVTDASDADMAGDEGAKSASDKPKRRWRFSRSQNKLEPGSALVGAMSSKEQMSKSTIGSQQRRESQEPVGLVTQSSDLSGAATSSHDQAVFSDGEKDKKGPLGWIRGKINERKDKDNEKRSKTPERKAGAIAPGMEESLPVRGASLEAARTPSTAPAAEIVVPGTSSVAHTDVTAAPPASTSDLPKQ